MSTSIRNKDWVLNALWSACESYSVSPSIATSSNKRHESDGFERRDEKVQGAAGGCIMSIPLTSLFKDGLPFKTMVTDEFSGRVMRVDLSKVQPDRLSTVRGHLGDRSLLSLRILLDDYAGRNSYGEVQKDVEEDERFLAKVYYTDGDVEDVRAKTLNLLMRNKEWRLQVLMIQGFIPSLSTHTGLFSRQPRVRSKLEADQTITADKLTESIAKYIERAYAQQSIDNSTNLDMAVRLHVENLTCTFCLDHKDRTIFLYSDYTEVEIRSNNRQSFEESLAKEKIGREEAAAQSVSSQLQAMLIEAHKQGLSVESSFEHFDVDKNGYVDVDMLIDGLARLSIGVTYPVGESVLELIGGVGASFITLRDFQVYLNKILERESLYSTTNISGERKGQGMDEVGKRSNISQQVSSQQSVRGSGNCSLPFTISSYHDIPCDARISAKFLPPPKDWNGIGRSFADISASQGMSWYNEDGEEEIVKGKEQLPLPLPEGLYTTAKGKSASSGVFLPSWARNRSHRALHSLQTSADRMSNTLKRKRGEESRSQSQSGNYEEMHSTSNQGRNKSTKKGVKSSSKGKSDERVPSPLRNRDLTTLNLQTVRSGMQEGDMLLSSKDELFHVDQGVVMTFRILDGAEISRTLTRTKEELDSLRYHSILSIREKSLVKSELEVETPSKAGQINHEAKEAWPEQPRSFTLVVIPDLTMTLDTLQLHLEGILSAFPFARIVLIGILGLPNTVWPTNWVLNSDLQARTVAHLIHNLYNCGRLFFTPPSQEENTGFPLDGIEGHHLLFMGFGFGSFHLSRFICQHLASLPLPLVQSVRSIILTNGFLRINKKLRQIVRDLRLALLQANLSEAHELITSLHFHDEFLATHDRKECLSRFWKTRKNLSVAMQEESNAAVRNLSGFMGVLEQLRGLLISPDEFDGAQLLTSTDVPVVVIQSTENVFVDPKQAAVFSPDQLPPERFLVDDLVDSLERNSVYMAWLKAGHEVLQERTPFILGVISSLAKLLGLTSVKSSEHKDVRQSASLVDDPFDVLSGDISFNEDQSESAGASVPNSVGDWSMQEMEFGQPIAVEDTQSLPPSHVDQHDNGVEENKANGEPAPLASFEDNDMEIDSLEKARRAQQQLERKKRQLKLARQQQLEVFYERERLDKERASESKECKWMMKEDQRSKAAADYALQCEISELSKKLAKEKMAELQKLRNEELAKRAEEERAFQRSLRVEQRRKQARELVKRIEQEELTLQGMKEGGYDLPSNPFDINGVLSASNRIMRDLMECRQKYVEAIARQELLDEKHDLFLKQMNTLENDERRLRRAIRLIEVNPAVVGRELNAEVQLKELRGSLHAKQSSLLEMISLSKERENQLYTAYRNVQLLKLASKERDRLMTVRLEELNKMETKLNDKLKEQKMVKESLLVQRDRLRVALLTHQKRVDVVEKEINRIRGHKGKLVDTDVWVEGVMQRCVTKELKNHLKVELAKAEKLKKDASGELEGIRHKIFEVTERIAQAKRDVDKVSSVTKILFKSFRKFSATPVLEIAKNFKKLKTKAEMLELQRSKTADIEKIFFDANSNSLVDKIRLKESEIRTKDERQFVGLDLILHPEEYIHLSAVEIEQMQFDSDYHCTLGKSDIERILKLPEAVNLALPFLHTPEEINAHRLLNKFLRNMDEAFFVNRDFIAGSQNSNGGLSSGMVSTTNDGKVGAGGLSTSKSLEGVDGTALSAQTMEEAEIAHDVLVREALRDRLRATFEDEVLTEDEKKWIEMDKVLAPHVYGLDDGENLIAKQDHVLDAIKQESIVAMTSSSIKPAKLKGRGNKEHDFSAFRLDGSHEGDVYEPLRRLFQLRGQDLLFDQYKCRFSRQDLLRIHSSRTSELKDAFELEAKALLEKYFVSDEESIMGHARLVTLMKVNADINNVIQSADKRAEEDIKANKLDFDRVSTQMTVQSATGDIPMTERSQLSVDSNSASAHGTSQGIGTTIDSSTERHDVKRIWGSWSQVHPASQGNESQTTFFMLSNFDASRDHPACYAIREEGDEEEVDDEDGTFGGGDEVGNLSHDASSLLSPRQLGLSLLRGGSSVHSSQMSKLMSRLNDPRSEYFVADSIEELAQQESRILRGKACLLLESEPMTLLNIQGATLQARQSRSHYFTIPERESLRILEITVSVIFQGVFSTTGYRLGRLAASLFRLPPESSMNKKNATTTHIMPLAVGYTPYDGVSPNLPDSLGRIVIIHKPKQRPIPAGTFQLIVGAASTTVYSIMVHAKYARSALPVIDEAIEEAKRMQTRLPICLEELDSIAESLRLAERKLVVCEKMIQEAELETQRCQQGMQVLTAKIEKDDEEMSLMEDERRDLERELSIMEVEYSQWARVFASRCQEKDDIKSGIDAMYLFRREREEEQSKIEKKLENSRRDLPACIRLLRTMTEAVNVAMTLNTEVVGISEEAGAAATGDWGGIRLSTPAEDVRRVLKQYGFAALMLEEQQWCLLDQVVHPHKYEWLREKEEKERQERILLGKKPKEDKHNPALDPFKLNKSEIEYILEAPFSMLNRREVIVRKLLTKYHDDKEFMKKAISAVAYSFDPHLAERVRAKHPSSYSKEEKEWASIDRILHPEVWKFYVHRSENFMDRNAKEASLAPVSGKRTTAAMRKITGGMKAVGLIKSATQETSSPSATSTANEGGTLGLQQVIQLEGEDLNAVIDRLQQSTHIKLRQAAAAADQAKGNEDWECRLPQDDILRIWKTPRHFLKTDDERRTYKLLQKFNGPYTSYMDMIAQANRRKGKVIKTGSHIQWEKLGKLVSKDTDFRARQLLREIDRAASTRNEFIHSDVLHANDQKFPTKVLRTHLEDALDNLLIDQIKDRERADKYRVDQVREDSDNEDGDMKIAFDEIDENPNFHSLKQEIGDVNGKDKEILSKVQRRANRRQQRKEELNALDEKQEMQVLRTKQMLAAKKTGQQWADLILENQLGSGACLACRSRKCKWRIDIDMETCTERKRVLDAEIERIRLDRDNAVFESDIALSAQLGGNRIFRRHDLLDELNGEIRDLQLRIELSNVDKELHDAYATRKEVFESEHLHGYRVILWTNNARKALEARQSRLVALCVTKEVVDDILDSMLEGWVFGERQSEYHAMGYVPTIKKDGFLRAGQDQVNAVVAVVRKMKDRADRKRQGLIDNEAKRGQMLEKAYEVELVSQEKRKEVKIARDKNEHEHLLDETENTLKFGLFMLTLMYFRAMTFLKREQKSWGTEDEEIGVKDKKKPQKVMTDERMRMIDEENKVALRQKKIDQILAKCMIGEARRREREANERKEAIAKMQAMIRRQKLEVAAINLIQKVYRGHLGRKAAKRWALKRAELGAMNALLNATAIAIQRVYRGYRGRLYAIVKRQEMAQFIALMRVQESAQDEEIYWQTHPWSRFKRRQKEWVHEKMEKMRTRKVMGGSRLSQEEQAQLEGKTLEEIKREIEGLDEDDGVDLVLPEETDHGLRVDHSERSGRSKGSTSRRGSSRRLDSAGDLSSGMLSGIEEDDLLDD